MTRRVALPALVAVSAFLSACGDGGAREQVPESALYDFANTCVTLSARIDGRDRWLAADESAETYVFVNEESEASRFFAKPSDLGTYLFYDDARGYVVAEDGPLLRQTRLRSDLDEVSDTYVSGAEWILEPSERVSLRIQLRHRRSELLFGRDGLTDRVGRAAHFSITPTSGCTQHPEMALHASGEVTRTRFDDGELFGFVDTHSHILSNFGFGGGGIFHGAAYHRLGVEHAMGSCEPFHGEEGRADIIAATTGGNVSLDIDGLLGFLSSGQLDTPNHATDGWPTFSDWPTVRSATHQTQYYVWLERAWRAGLRLMVQHAVSNEALCGILGETQFQPIRWDCRDMVNIDRQFEEIHNLERYIDAQAGGPGEGFLRIVTSPEEAREVIADGKLAIVLGIEVPALFECYVTPGEDDPECNDAHIRAQLDEYYDRGLRVLFPVHKLDNAFTPGDGSRGIFELANFMETGHWSNFTDQCPDVSSTFDKGEVTFGGFNMPREEYLSTPPNEPLQLSFDPILDFLPFALEALEPPLEGDWCQAAGLTDAGRTLIREMMSRGIIPELDHLPRNSYIEVFDMLEAEDYPAAATHRNLYGGRIWDIGGISQAGIGRCADPDRPGSLFDSIRSMSADRVAAGLHRGVGFGFDLNGLAGVPGPRFGENANCGREQTDPVTYPFTSYGGDVVFDAPSIGERAVDFNEEGMIHIGMVAELIEDARRTGTSDEDMEILFRSAESYIRLWELAESRAAEIRAR